MKVKILHKFHDKADYAKVYLVGETITFDDSRAEYLIGLGLVEAEESEPAIAKASAKENDAPHSQSRKATTSRRRTAQKNNQ